MIYARFVTEADIEALVTLLKQHYKNIEWGQQGEDWIWIYRADMKVEIDNFTAMIHEIKSPSQNRRLVRQVITKLSEHYELDVLSEPMLEAHEE
ncbi:hypothetical protein R50073_00910 [Maricurvus nonylphenolicus]|uniref:hypothetical protein n=1 Tax=Maricurvus nonylphenolicus TaxID=1008307 RepID=UPI0036F35157